MSPAWFCKRGLISAFIYLCPRQLYLMKIKPGNCHTILSVWYQADWHWQFLVSSNFPESMLNYFNFPENVLEALHFPRNRWSSVSFRHFIPSFGSNLDLTASLKYTFCTFHCTIILRLLIDNILQGNVAQTCPLHHTPSHFEELVSQFSAACTRNW